MSKASKRNVLKSGTVRGKLPGMKEWRLFDLEVTMTELHIYEGGYDHRPSRKHLRSMQLDDSDVVGEGKTSARKKEYQLYIKRVDGKYLFTCDSLSDRADWMTQLQRVISGASIEPLDDLGSPTRDVFSPDPTGRLSTTSPRTPPSRKAGKPTLPKRGHTFSETDRTKVSARDQPLPPVPSDSSGSSDDFNPRVSIFSVDSGIGPSTDGLVRRSGASSVPTSGDGSFNRLSGVAVNSGQSHSDSGQFSVGQLEEEGEPDELENYKWFWGPMNRSDCETKLHMEGKVGNFVVRINANGSYVLSLWRNNGVHHHKILQHKGMYRFDKAAVQAEGCGLVDLLDTYMKNCVDKVIRPFGGALHLVYHEPWNPPDVDMDVLSKRLRARKEYNEAEAARAEAEAARANQMKTTVGQESQGMQPKERYTWVELDTGPPPPSSQAPGPKRDSIPGEQVKRKPLPPPPVKPGGVPVLPSSPISGGTGVEQQVPPSPPSRNTKPPTPEKLMTPSHERQPQHAIAEALQQRLKAGPRHTRQPREHTDLTTSTEATANTKSPPPVTKKPNPTKKPSRPQITTGKPVSKPSPQPKPKPVQPPDHQTVHSPPTLSPTQAQEAPLYGNVHFSPHRTASPGSEGKATEDRRSYENHSVGPLSPAPYQNFNFTGGGQPTKYGTELANAAVQTQKDVGSGASVNGTTDDSTGVYQNVNYSRKPPVRTRWAPRK